MIQVNASQSVIDLDKDPAHREGQLSPEALITRSVADVHRDPFAEQQSCLSPVAVRLRRAVCLTTPLRQAPVVGDDALRRERPRYRSEFLEHVMLAYAGDRIFSGSSRHCGSSGSSLDRL